MEQDTKKKTVKTTKATAKKEVKKAEEKVNIKKTVKEVKTKTATKTPKETKPKKIVRKFIQKVKKENKTKSKEAKENQKLLLEKKSHPTFRGRFGKKYIRKKSNKKWQKWRKPRSIDLDRGLQHGYRPKIGYANKTEIKGIHPSGYIELRVENVNDLEKVKVKINAIRIGATVGKKKRNEIIKIANQKGIWVLN